MGLRSSFPKKPPGHLCGCIYEGQLSGGQERNVACSNVPIAAISRHPIRYSSRQSLRTHAFKNMLASPSMDDDAIDEVYHDATKVQCINKDV
jgi:hypothetical protein